MSLQNITLGNLGVLEFTANLCEKIKDLQGDLCEAGVAYGGQLVNMHQHSQGKKIYAFDSFQGISEHCDKDIEFTAHHGKRKGDKRKSIGVSSVTLEDCKANIQKFIPNLERFVFIEGWFADTLPKLTNEKFSLVRLDCDVYPAYVDALKYLEPRLVKGGYLVIDDFVLTGCQDALKEYFGSLEGFVFDKQTGNAYKQKT